MRYERNNTVGTRLGTHERGRTACALTDEVMGAKSLFCCISHRIFLTLGIYSNISWLTHESVSSLPPSPRPRIYYLSKGLMHIHIDTANLPQIDIIVIIVSSDSLLHETSHCEGQGPLPLPHALVHCRSISRLFEGYPHFFAATTNKSCASLSFNMKSGITVKRCTWA